MNELLGKELQGNYFQELIAIPVEEYEHLKKCEQELKAIKENIVMSAKIQMENYM